MSEVRIKAKNLKVGDVIGGQRVHQGCIHGHSGRDLAHRHSVSRTYVVVKMKCGTGLEMLEFEDDEMVFVRRPAYNKKPASVRPKVLYKQGRTYLDITSKVDVS